ncbi:MAG: RNA methyltransferase [Deltaproteobacteria bacterium]|nr:RNA methyltransferase [Deltaproteobacteria bacterium]
MNLLENIIVVLVKPKGSLNIGSAARAMSNSGLSDLRIVSGARHLNQAAWQMAMAGTNILENAQTFDRLEDAVRDCHLVVGTSRRKGKARGLFLNPIDGVNRIFSVSREKKTAILFGSEDVGLTSGELMMCHFSIELPANPQSCSYNLAQAVLLLGHYIFTAASGSKFENREGEPFEKKPRATRGELEGLYEHMLQTMRRIRFFRKGKSEDRMRDFRYVFERAALDSREVRMFRGMMKQINYCMDKLEKGESL